MEKYHDIYDRIAKRCISLSDRTTINLINGLYGTNYPLDSKVAYHWTENTNDELKRTLADTIVTINNLHSYHIEFQMTKDGTIILRMVEYGFYHAIRTSDMDTICFPEPLVVYLYNKETMPDEYSLRIKFGTQGEFIYTVPVYKYLEKTMEELNDKKLIVLIPFQLLRLRREIEKERTKENMAALQTLITHDIMDSLNKNVRAGNITQVDSWKIRRMVLHLYQHIYGDYEELIEEGVNQVAEEALIFDIDILDYKMRKLEESFEELEALHQSLEAQHQSLEAQHQSLEAQHQSLEAQHQSLEALHQSLEAQHQSLETRLQIWKLSAHGMTVDEISIQTGYPKDTVSEILSE